MSIVINTNIGALNAGASLSANSSTLTQAMQRLSTGSKINSAADNAAGSAISTRMTAQLNGYTQATQNTNDAISLVQTAANDMGNIVGYLQKIRELAVQSASGTNSASDKASLNAEAQQMLREVDRVAGSAMFNNISLLNGANSASYADGTSYTGTQITVQVGANATANDQITIDIANAEAANLGVGTSSVSGTTTTGALSTIDLTAAGGTSGGDSAIDVIDVAIQQVSDAQA